MTWRHPESARCVPFINRLSRHVLPRVLHGAGNAAQDVDFLACGGGAAEQLLQARHEFFGGGGVEKADGQQGLFQMREHCGDLRGIGGGFGGFG